jgi:hypothetical protein
MSNILEKVSHCDIETVNIFFKGETYWTREQGRIRKTVNPMSSDCNSDFCCEYCYSILWIRLSH